MARPELISVSCFSHAVHLAKAAFLTVLSPRKKDSSGKEIPVLDAPRGSADSVIDPDNEETEEEVDTLMKELAEAVNAMPAGSDETALLAGLLLKVCGFVSKMRRSLQAKKFFTKCCGDAKDAVLDLLPFCKTQ